MNPANDTTIAIPPGQLGVLLEKRCLAGERSSLFHEQIRIFHAARHFCGARWLVWENVPGAFSSNNGNDFGALVGAMAGCGISVPANGWGQEGVALGEHGLVEWAVLDAQWFGLAQRRRRVFAVLDTGNWPDRPPVLLERDSLRGDTAPRRKPTEGTAATLASGTRQHGRDYIPVPDTLIDQAHILGRNHEQENVVCAFQERGRFDGRRLDIGGDIAYALTAPSRGSRTQEGNIQVGSTVRRLTPRECERLQGFPDDYTQIPWRGKPAELCPDSPRYRALGNSMAVPVMRWIGQRIDAATKFEPLEKVA